MGKKTVIWYNGLSTLEEVDVLKKVTGEVIRFNKIMDTCMISVVKHNNIYLKMVIKILKKAVTLKHITSDKI